MKNPVLMLFFATFLDNGLMQLNPNRRPRFPRTQRWCLPQPNPPLPRMAPGSLCKNDWDCKYQPNLRCVRVQGIIRFDGLEAVYGPKGICGDHRCKTKENCRPIASSLGGCYLGSVTEYPATNCSRGVCQYNWYWCSPDPSGELPSGGQG